MFSVSSFYRAQLGAGDISFPWRGVWVSRVPSKVAFFVWLAVHGWILTLDNLMWRGHVLVNWCCLCCHDVESYVKSSSSSLCSDISIMGVVFWCI